MKIFLLVILVIALISCNKKKFFDGETAYQDDFESYSSLDDLLIEDETNWSFTQITRNSNSITVDSNFAHTGNKSLLFEGEPTDESGASKTSIAKQNFAFWEGETVHLSGWYFIEGEQSLQWMFLMDLEERTPIGAGPGMRLALVDGQLLVEHKYNEPNIVQSGGVLFPRNQWVHVEWEVLLSQKDKGKVKVWQDGVLIIDKENHRTLPSDFLYFQQGTKGYYNSCEIGITANSKENNARVWIDDVSFQKK